MISISKCNFFQSSHIIVDIGCGWWQEVPLQLVLQQHVVLRRKTEASSKKKKKRTRNEIVVTA